jgi:hypothetical protein
LECAEGSVFSPQKRGAWSASLTACSGAAFTSAAPSSARPIGADGAYCVATWTRRGDLAAPLVPFADPASPPASTEPRIRSRASALHRLMRQPPACYSGGATQQRTRRLSIRARFARLRINRNAAAYAGTLRGGYFRSSCDGDSRREGRMRSRTFPRTSGSFCATSIMELYSSTERPWSATGVASY